MIPYKRSNVEADQPWLTEEDHQKAEQLARQFIHEHPKMEPWKIDHLYERVEEGDQEAFRELYPYPHFILTPDFRVVQEPNLIRWGIFLEKAPHRLIDNTLICKGVERDRESGAPSFKTQETFVSTVFIGIVAEELFETMIFGGPLSQTCWRNSTLIDAKKCHFEAVNLGHLLNRYMKRHGRAFRKDWIRLENFWRLGRLRGDGWVKKHMPTMNRVYIRLNRAPGPPPLPQASFFLDLCQMFLPRPSLVEK